MTNKIACDSIFEGYKFKVPQYNDQNGLRSGFDKYGKPYWAFPYRFFEYNGTERHTYLKIDLVVRDKCMVVPNDWVQIRRVLGMRVKNPYNKYTGGRQMFISLIVEFDKITKSKNKEEYEENED